MAQHDSLTESPACAEVFGRVEWDPERWVVALRGEHDASTAPALTEVLLQRIEMDLSGVVLDLYEVTFMGVATVRVIAAARETLRRQGRCLLLFDASPSASLVLELCGVPSRPVASSLATWVAVPAQERGVNTTTGLGGL